MIITSLLPMYITSIILQIYLQFEIDKMLKLLLLKTFHKHAIIKNDMKPLLISIYTFFVVFNINSSFF